MTQAGFDYDGMEGMPEGVPLSVSIFADRAYVRSHMQEDALRAGLGVRRCGPLADMPDGEIAGELLLLDCPQADARLLAALARLDMRVAQSSAQLVVSTSMEALDAVFACLDQSNAQILVDPTRAERMVALGHALANGKHARLRELTENDRMTLLRLSEQVARIASRLDEIDSRTSFQGQSAVAYGAGDEADGAERLEAPVLAFHGADQPPPGARLRPMQRKSRPALPDPRLVRRIIRQRQARARFFDAALFADPAWDMLLDLAAARAEHARVSVTSLCIASGVPPTTALRWIAQMSEAGLFRRVEDDTDRRRAFIALTDTAADAMAAYFAELGPALVELA